jgi:hypothetical protein
MKTSVRMVGILALIRKGNFCIQSRSVIHYTILFDSVPRYMV